MKLIAITVACLLFVGCAPVVLHNPNTGQTMQCLFSGPTPIIAQNQCVSSYLSQGYVKTTPEAIQAQEKAKKDSTDIFRSSYEACRNNMASNPELALISGKIALAGPDAQTFAMLSNKEKPTEAEKTQIARYFDERKKCVEIANKYRSSFGWPPSLTLIESASNSAFDNLLVALHGGSLTYGDYARIRKEIQNNTASASIQAEDELKKNAADSAARAQMIANQNAIAQAQLTQAFAATQASTAMMIQANKPPPTINVNTHSHCTSMAVGNQVNTNCF